MKKVILDTNFLLIPEQFKVDIFAELEKLFGIKIELYIIDKTIDELKAIKGKDKFAAKLALQLIEKRNINQLTSEEYVDDAIVSICQRDKTFLVATNDSMLKKRLKKGGIITIELRQKKYLTINE